MLIFGIALSTAVICIGIWFTSFKDKKRKIIMYALAIVLLLYKACEYTIYGLNLQVTKIPIEFSTMTYFIFSITVIFNLRKLVSIAAFCSFISGLGYLISFMLIGEQFILGNGLVLAGMAFINHSIVFLGSMLLIPEIKVDRHEVNKILKFTFFYVFYVILMNQMVQFTQSFIFIRILLGADVLSTLFPDRMFTSYEYLLYFLVLYIVYRMCISIFFIIAKRVRNFNGGIKHEHTV
jgi:hypothetical protein